MDPAPRNRTNMLNLFDIKREENDFVKVCAPMVRYSKIAFRELVRQYNTDIVYTPMILANVFCASPYARNTEFTTTVTDSPVVLQLASSNADEFATAAILAGPFVDAVDINCGCPQRWAYKDKIGSYLMERPDLIADMVSTLRRRAPHIVRTIKIRVHADPKLTVDLARTCVAAGAQVIAVHGRTRHQKPRDPVNYGIIKLIKDSVDVPVIANGDIFSLQDARDIVTNTGVDGVMAARGLLENPALYAGFDKTPPAAVHAYLDVAIRTGTHPFVIHHHLMYMTSSLMSPYEKRRFNVCTTVPSLIDWFNTNWDHHRSL